MLSSREFLQVPICAAVLCLVSAPALDAQLPNFPSMPQRAQAEEYQPPPPSQAARGAWHKFFDEAELRVRHDSRVIPDAYLAILQRWADGPEMKTLDLLAEFEARLDRSDLCFITVQNRNLEILAELEPGSLVPVLALHTFAWRHHLDHRRFNFLASTTQRLERWARLHVTTATDRARAKDEAAEILTRLAAIIWESGYINLQSQALSALDEALELQDEHVLARHMRAMIAEKEGRYKAAHKDLEILHRAKPERQDIALRLAVQEARLDRTDSALARLRSIAEAGLLNTGPLNNRGLDKSNDGATPSIGELWPSIVATQEWARLEIDRGENKEARRVLEAGAARHPDIERFEIMLASLDRAESQKPSQRSAKLVDGFDRHQGSEPSPRLRYLQLSASELAENAAKVEEAMLSALATLERGLGKIEESVPSRRCSGLSRDFRPKGLSMDPSTEGEESGALPESRGPIAQTPEVPLPSPAATPPKIEPARERAEPPIRETSPRQERSSQESVAPSRAKIEAALRRGVYIDPQTGETIAIDLALDLELRQIYVTPSRFGRRGTELEQHEVELLDEDVKQEIVTFEQGDIPFTATVLIDASGSMAGSRLARALAGAQAFIDGMAAHDRSRLIVATDRLENATPLVSASADLRQHLRASAGGGTALFDHLFLAIDTLEREQGRKVVIVLSDGYDLMSAVPMELISEALRRSQIQLYWVRLRDGQTERMRLIPPTSWRPRDSTRKELERLEQATRRSGGRVVPISPFDDVGAAFGEVLAELRSQIAIGYYADPAHGDGRWRQVEVKTSRSGVRLRHVEGYFDD